MADNPSINILPLLAEISRLARADFRRRAQHLGLTQPQWQLLFRLNRNPGLTQVALAEFLDVHPVTVTQALDRLAKSGLVERRRCTEDRRAFRVYVTAAAEPLMGELSAIGDQTRAAAVGTLSPESQRELEKSLLEMKRSLLAARDETAATHE